VHKVRQDNQVTGQIVGEPGYKHLARLLREDITSGRLVVGDKIPSTTRLMKDHRVSITVVRSAIALLQQEGLLVGRTGMGVFVTATPAQIEDQPADLAEMRDRVAALEARVGELQAGLLELYARTGQPYPDRGQQDSQDLSAQRKADS
jgi:DNA-binding FadR family transcriptional regulator